jgi:hypothetical protein
LHGRGFLRSIYPFCMILVIKRPLHYIEVERSLDLVKLTVQSQRLHSYSCQDFLQLIKWPWVKVWIKCCETRRENVRARQRGCGRGRKKKLRGGRATTYKSYKARPIRSSTTQVPLCISLKAISARRARISYARRTYVR